ncbi:hypothetical protein SLEP1_g51121 [Rubroshorea leprosula]|uniref:Uncharacterized protein n=1 Tax=Rubroshorea leprosula TaxID=152421 RepID=A0AAV5M4Q2_9ROSI|nr:hypothetical protein SLEP1_g51121 [Rubroshorea leprosula]
MDLKLTLSCILLSCLFPLLIADDVKVTIKGATLIAGTDDNFVCATLNWWPSEKCDYNQCPWGEAGLFNLRCLQMKRRDQLNNLFNQTGALVTFGLNALYGRKESQVEKGLWVGNWNSQNARDLIAYTVSKGYKTDSYEFGHELFGSGKAARVEADQNGAWVGEAFRAYNSGSKDVSHTFADGFWYLDQLGMTSTFNHKVFCRQTFIGGNYALLNTTTFTPNPDYYGLCSVVASPDGKRSSVCNPPRPTKAHHFCACMLTVQSTRERSQCQGPTPHPMITV